jgi:hypothetical protein
MTTDIDNANAQKIRPGLMISLKTKVRGGVTYLREDLEAPAQGSDGKGVEEWKTTKIVEDAAEHERARKTINKARGLIAKVCITTDFGLLCPEGREAELNAAVAEAKKLVAEFNATATFTHAKINALKGRIASTEEESARAIGEEVSSLLADMNTAIDKLDVEAIREAATKAAKLEAMLGPERAEAVAGAVEQARKAARQITKRVQNEGEAAAIVLKDIARGSLEKARIAFLDFEEQAPEAVAASLPAANVQRVAALDLSDAVAPEGVVVNEV